MKILVLNCGSSSLKYQLLDMETEEIITKGNYERIGGSSFLKYYIGEEKFLIEKPVQHHVEAIEFVLNELFLEKHRIVNSLEEIDSVGHRIVHGGKNLTTPSIINERVIKEIERCIRLAPLHNPGGLLGIKACQKLLPNKLMVAVFDTTFHQTLPKKAYIYSIPYEYYEKYGVRKYGAHGTSHKYVSSRLSRIEGVSLEKLKIISCHLGNGASICAIKDGKSIDTSMGLTPLAGIPMGSRAGDLDPSILIYLMRNENLSVDEIYKALNETSGVYGISGISPDFRDILEVAQKDNDERAILSLDFFAYNVAQYIAKYIVSLNGVDRIIFTAGVGENSPEIRKMICEYLNCFSIKLDDKKNEVIIGDEGVISSKDSKAKVYVIPTNEELMIARETRDLLIKF